VLRNIEAGKFARMSFLAGILRGLLERPVEVTRGIRAGSIFMLPAYVWVAFVVGRYHDKAWDDPVGILTISALVALGAIALMQLVGLPFRGTPGQSIFRVAVVDAEGEPASSFLLFARWGLVWLPLFVPVFLALWLLPRSAAGIAFVPILLLWIGAAGYAVFRPDRGLHDGIVGTWVVRR